MNTSHPAPASAAALPKESFFGFVALNPMANKISVQMAKRSIEPSKAASHFAESSGRNAPGLEATTFCKSTVDGSFRKIIRMLNRPWISHGHHAKATMASATLKVVLVAPERLKMPSSTAAESNAATGGRTTPSTYPKMGANFTCFSIRFSRSSGVICCTRELSAVCF